MGRCVRNEKAVAIRYFFLTVGVTWNQVFFKDGRISDLSLTSKIHIPFAFGPNFPIHRFLNQRIAICFFLLPVRKGFGVSFKTIRDFMSFQDKELINNTSLIVNQTGPCNHKFYALIKSDCKSGFYKDLFTYLCWQTWFFGLVTINGIKSMSQRLTAL